MSRNGLHPPRTWQVGTRVVQHKTEANYTWNTQSSKQTINHSVSLMKLQLEKQSPEPLELCSQCDHELFSLIARNGNIKKKKEREKNINLVFFFLERAKRIHNVWRWQDMKENFLQAEATYKKERKKELWLQNIGRASRLCSLTNLFSLLCSRTEAAVQEEKLFFLHLFKVTFQSLLP